MQLVLTPELILEAYRQGLFPMAYSADSPYVHWICPEERGQLSIEGLHIPRSLKKTTLKNLNRNGSYFIKINSDFAAVIHECAQVTDERPDTWINESIIKVYQDLHKQGHAHSVECWEKTDEGDVLVGGLYGLSIGGAFFGESMFSRAPNASKIALVHLAARLWKGGYALLDTQFVNDHLTQFGVYEVSHHDYKAVLDKAVELPGDFMLENLSEREIVSAYFDMRENSTQ